MAAKSTCAYGVDFTPATYGAIGDTLGLTDNNLNVAAATQSIATNGTGYIVVTLTAVTPAGSTVGGGATVRFSSNVSSGGVVWSDNGGSFSSNSWTAPNTPGTYTITATSVEDPSASASTTIIVSAPVITTQPVSKNVCSGYNPSFTIGASYATSYQWYMGESLVGTNSSTLTFNDVTTASDGNYSCTVTNRAGVGT